MKTQVNSYFLSIHQKHATKFSKDHLDVILCFEQVIRKKKEEQERFIFLKSSADAGDAGNQFAVALCYNEGIGVKQDSAQALRYLFLASEQGHLKAIVSLGLSYHHSKKQQIVPKPSIF